MLGSTAFICHFTDTPEAALQTAGAIGSFFGLAGEQVLPLGASQLYERQYRRKDGSLVWVELQAHLLRGRDGQPDTIWAVIRETTERLAHAQRHEPKIARPRAGEDAMACGS